MKCGLILAYGYGLESKRQTKTRLIGYFYSTDALKHFQKSYPDITVRESKVCDGDLRVTVETDIDNDFPTFEIKYQCKQCKGLHFSPNGLPQGESSLEEYLQSELDKED